MTKRMLTAGDPSKFVWWRWMPITHPESDGVYLNRLYIFRTPLGGLMLHNLRTPDWERHGHSHPWALGNVSFLTWVVRGGYTEQAAIRPEYDDETPHYETRTRKSKRVYVFRADEIHYIDSVKPNTWTLVWSMPKSKARTWGFWVPGRGIVRWSEYLDQYGQNGAR